MSDSFYQNDDVSSEISESLYEFIEMPLDVSFRALASIEEINEEMQLILAEYVKPDVKVKLLTNIAKLSNNAFTNITGIDQTLSNFIFEPSSLAWIDLSFNNLSEIDKGLASFKNLKMLYFHGNCVAKLQEVDKLSELPLLMKITLHGNVIESENNYRPYVLARLPHLKMLDFSDVTHTDRAKVKRLQEAEAKLSRRRPFY